MGYMRNHGIAVSSFALEYLEPAHKIAVDIFGPQVTPILPPAINGELAFFVGPDGSKEGWPDSETGDARRAKFIAAIGAMAFEDGGNCVRYCEFFWCDDNKDSQIVSHN